MMDTSMNQATLVSTDTFSQESLSSATQRIVSLLELAKHQPAIIEDIIDNARFGEIDSVVGQRLKDLGFLPNTAVRIVATGLFGRPPFAVQLASGVQFSLRVDELKKIRCRIL